MRILHRMNKKQTAGTLDRPSQEDIKIIIVRVIVTEREKEREKFGCIIHIARDHTPPAPSLKYNSIINNRENAAISEPLRCRNVVVNANADQPAVRFRVTFYARR